MGKTKNVQRRSYFYLFDLRDEGEDVGTHTRCWPTRVDRVKMVMVHGQMRWGKQRNRRVCLER